MLELPEETLEIHIKSVTAWKISTATVHTCHVHTHTPCAHTPTHPHTHTHTRAHTHMHTHTHARACTHTHTHTHAQTQVQLSPIINNVRSVSGPPSHPCTHVYPSAQERIPYERCESKVWRKRTVTAS